MLKIKKNFFESDYKKYGNRAQREYPNTELISFIKTKIKKKRGAKKIKILILCEAIPKRFRSDLFALAGSDFFKTQDIMRHS